MLTSANRELSQFDIGALFAAVAAQKPSLYLTDEEVRTFGGDYAYRKSQARVLAQRGIPFEIQGASGRILVLRADIDKLSFAPTSTTAHSDASTTPEQARPRLKLAGKK